MDIKDLITKGSLKELSKLLKEKEITSLELTKAYLKQAEVLNGKVNSFIKICPETAIEGAKTADKLITLGQAKPLTGIPLAVKDNICTMDIATTCASKMLESFIPPYNATVIKRLAAQGYVLLGKTNMDEFAMGSTSATSYFGGVYNPYNLNCVAGGSSGGSAAAVAANMCAAALGSDTGGSVRQPAAFCGVTGLKPTYGTVSRYGLVAFASSLDQIGPIAKSAEDCGVILNAIAGADLNDSTCNELNVSDYTSKLGMSLKNVTIGLPKEFFELELEKQVKQSVLNAAKVYRSLGAKIKEVSLPSLKYGVAAYYLISSAEAASNLSRYDGVKYGYRSNKGTDYAELIKNTRREGFGWEVKRRIMLGNYALSSGYYEEYYNKAVKIREKIKADYSELLKECDILLTPTVPTTAYSVGESEKNLIKTYSADVCTVTANITGLPAISTTCGYNSKGMPIGMSLVGRAFDEATIIAVADSFEKTFQRREAAL